MKEHMINCLNVILGHECKHFAHYLNSSMVVRGVERAIFGPIFKKEMESELEHIREFGDKIVSMGGNPSVCFPMISRTFLNAQEMLEEAIKMEREVLRVYHEMYPMAESYAEKTNDMSIMLLLEENIEHTTKDVEELEKLRIL